MKKTHTIIAAILVVMMLSFLTSSGMADTVLKKGDSGEEVARMQERLIQLGYLEGTGSGTFDDETETALISFQTRNGLLATGMADRITWNVLFSDSARENYVATKSTYQEMPLWAYETEEGMAYDASVYALSAPSPTWIPFAEPVSWNTNEYTFIKENGFQSVSASPLSTFAADVDTASYAQVRSLILSGKDVPEDAVRIEEMLNYFQYDYPQPMGDDLFGVFMELASCPWNSDNLLLQVGLQARSVSKENRPRHNLVFLIDVSGSMLGEDRLDLVKRAFLMLLEELEPTDTVSIVTYASRDEVVLSGVPAADKVRVMEAISDLKAGGSTNSASGIQTAYQLAEKYSVPGGVNRILMATDGDFNVGMTSEGELARLVTEKKQNGVCLTMLGVGYGNYKDNKLEALADYGDGNYYYLDSVFEARRALITEAGGTFLEVAKDVKLQLDFNPAKVTAYRLIGYEDRVMAAQDFADDSKDGGEIGSGHRVTALYEIVPVGSNFDINVPQSKYQEPAAQNESDEWLTLNIRAKRPGIQESELWSYPLSGTPADELSDQMKFAAAVAEMGMLLRNSPYKGNATFTSALDLSRKSNLVTGDPYKEELVYLLTLLERNGIL